MDSELEDLDNLEDSKYIGRTVEACTEDNPLGGLHVYTDETSSDITSKLHTNATTLKNTILNARNFDELKTAFGSLPEAELKETINYIGSPIIDFLYVNLIEGISNGQNGDRHPVPVIRILFFEACIQTDNVHLLKFLILRGIDLTYNNTGKNALFYAISHERVKIVKFLLDNGLDPNEGISFYGEPLVVAAKIGNLSIAKLLAKKGANVNARAGHALTEAARKGHLSIFRYLIEAGAKIYAIDDYYIDFNPLIDTVGYNKGYLPIVEYIIENNLIPIRFISRALVHAADNNHLEIVKYMVRKCDVSIQSKIAVCYRAKFHKNQEIIDFMKTEGGVTDLDIEQHPDYNRLFGTILS